MDDYELLELLKTDVGGWNRWMAENAGWPHFRGMSLYHADISGANLQGVDLQGADMRGAKLVDCDARGAWLAGTNLTGADLRNCKLQGAELENAILVETDLRGANLNNCRIYGVSAWNVKLLGAEQQNLVITRDNEPAITVDNLEVAQFIYLLLNNAKLREVINTVARKSVLLLGRFGGGGLEVLHAIAGKLRERDYVPVIFEFARPEDRNFTETVRTLVGLARFVIVDLSGPSVPQELYATVPHSKIPFVPILEEGRRPYSMFADLLEHEHVLKPVVRFRDSADLIGRIDEAVLAPAEARVRQRQALLEQLFAAT